MARSEMNTTQKVQTCLDFIDHRLETSSEQTIQIAEMIIDDIKTLTQSYADAIKLGQLQQHAEMVRKTQLNWVNQLHDIILQQTDRDLNGQVIQSLQKFANSLNQQQVKHIPFELPAIIDRQDKSLDYLNQSEIDLLIGQQSLFENVTRH